MAKFDAAGNHLWSARYGGVGNEIGTAVAVDKSGDVIVTGYFSGSFDLGGDTLVASGTDVFVAKLDGSGKHIWSEALGGSGNQAARHAGVDDAGEIAVIGMANPAVDSVVVPSVRQPPERSALPESSARRERTSGRWRSAAPKSATLRLGRALP